MATREEWQRPLRLTIKPNPSKPRARVVLRSKSQAREETKTSGKSSVSPGKFSSGKSSPSSVQGNVNSSPSRSGSIGTHSYQMKAANGSISSTRIPPKTSSTVATSGAATASASPKTSQTVTNRASASTLRAPRTTTVERPPWGSSTVAVRPARPSETSIVPNRDDPFHHSSREQPAAAIGPNNDLAIESKIRSITTRNEASPSQNDSTIRSVKSPKSVRWDPAVIFCSPPLESKPPPPETSSLPDEFEDCLKTVFSWKKGDRRRLQLLLDTLRQIDDEEQAPIDAENEETKDQAPIERLIQGNEFGGKGMMKRTGGSQTDEQSASLDPKPILRNIRSEGAQLALDQMQIDQDRLFERMKALQAQKSKLDDQMQEDVDMWFDKNIVPALPSPIAREELPKVDDISLSSICGPRPESRSPTRIGSKKVPKDGFQNYRRTLTYSGSSDEFENFTPTLKSDLPRFSPEEENRRYLNMLKKIGIVTSPQGYSDVVDMPSIVRRNVIPQEPLPTLDGKRLNPRARSFNLSSSSSTDWSCRTQWHSASTSSDWNSYVPGPTPESSVEEDSASSLPGHQIDSFGPYTCRPSSARRANTVSEPVPELGGSNIRTNHFSKRRDTVSDPGPIFDQLRTYDTVGSSDDSGEGHEIDDLVKIVKPEQKKCTDLLTAYFENSTSASKTFQSDRTNTQFVFENCENRPTNIFRTRELAQRMRAYLERSYPVAEDFHHSRSKEELAQQRNSAPSGTGSNEGFTAVSRRRQQQSPVQRQDGFGQREHVHPLQRDFDETIRRFSEILQIPDGIPRRRRREPNTQPFLRLVGSILEPPGFQAVSAGIDLKKLPFPVRRAVAKLNRTFSAMSKNSASDTKPSHGDEAQQTRFQELLAKLKRNPPYHSDLAQGLKGSGSRMSKSQLSSTQGTETKLAASQCKLSVAGSRTFVPRLAATSTPEQKPITPQMMPEIHGPIRVNTAQHFQHLNREAAPFQITPEAQEPIWINTSQPTYQPTESSMVHPQDSVPLAETFATYFSYNSAALLGSPSYPYVLPSLWATEFVPDEYCVNPQVNAAVETATPGGRGQREAHQMNPNWANQILNNFQSKYPKTGTPVPRPPMLKAPRRPRQTPENRHAAVIQQRLEYLLLQKKEEEAMKELMAVQTSIITKAPYHERSFASGIF